MNTISYKVPLQTDENGLVGRECPQCHEYFKVKFGTGLSTTEHICPYCEYKSNSNNFLTTDQVEYFKSFIAQKVLQPAVANFQSHLKSLENSSSRYLKITVNTKPIKFELREYQEKELETNVVCDNCGLVFSIYGVFSHCPDCGKINSLTILNRSLKTCLKRLNLSKEANLASELAKGLLIDALNGCVSSFDAFGKSLKKEHQVFFEGSQRNIFQNLFELDQIFLKKKSRNIENHVGKEDFNFALKMFQVRHINEHNAGVIDDNFSKKVPGYSHLIGRKYNLSVEEVEKLVVILEKIANYLTLELEKEK